MEKKVTKSNRRRRLEIRRLKTDGCDSAFSKQAKQEDQEVMNTKKDDDSASSPSSAYSRSSASDSDGVAPFGILAAGGEICGSGDDLRPFPCVSHGSVSMIGRRREMEDAVTVAPGFVEPYDFFGVYDGHGGVLVAQVCRERLHVVLAKEVERRGPSDVSWRDAMEACFGQVDGEVMARAERGSAADRTVGSTAVVAVVGMGRIVVANCGDSRAVLCRGGVAIPLSSDHKPDREDELERVEAAGGKVINWNGQRVLGVLATSRSIGDHYLKPYVTSEPEVTVTERTEKDEFLILASDGLWDMVSNELACRVVKRCLTGRPTDMFPGSTSGRGSGAAEAAALLTDLAISRGSRDNISVVVVELR